MTEMEIVTVNGFELKNLCSIDDNKQYLDLSENIFSQMDIFGVCWIMFISNWYSIKLIH